MRDDMKNVTQQLEAVVFGQQDAIRQVLTALLAGGHVLLQGVPGVGKTRLATSLAALIGGSYRRVQFTPDLMPSDILGNAVFHLNDSSFEVHKGPIFTNVVLADEVNRTPPKTQAALLEAMEERQVSIYGETMPMPNPFFVIATQNPIEYEGTYPLPEAQLDRFLLQVNVDYPALDAEIAMLAGHRGATDRPLLAPVLEAGQLAQFIREVRTVTASPEILHYIAQLIRRTRDTAGVLLGASPRAATAVLDAARAEAWLEGRDYLVPDDVLDVIRPCLRHRLVLNPNAELEGVAVDEVVDRVVETVEVPR